jgi:hypothetical protein
MALQQQVAKSIRLQDLKLIINANINVDINAQISYTTGETDRVYDIMWSSNIVDIGVTTSYGVLSFTSPTINDVEVSHCKQLISLVLTLCALHIGFVIIISAVSACMLF